MNNVKKHKRNVFTHLLLLLLVTVVSSYGIGYGLVIVLTYAIIAYATQIEVEYYEEVRGGR